LWYLPIIPRLKWFFGNVNDAKNLRWHSSGRKCDGLLRHAAAGFLFTTSFLGQNRRGVTP